MPAEWEIVWLTARLAALATLLVLPLAIAVAWILARKNWRGKSIVETLVSLPLVIPPVATGLLLLELAGRRSLAGRAFQWLFGLSIVFTWRGAVLAMMVMSFPLIVRSSRIGFEGVNGRLEQLARTLGAGELHLFRTITLPLASRGIIAGAMMGFARALGEFGATILIAGNIPGRTSTLSVSIYQLIELGQEDAAWRLVGLSIAITFVTVWIAETILRRQEAMAS
ncbi:MAG TPA: molybdate ABC transporter permease subunit [Thermoanaerobaculia bacterium]|nr:molybdate ABC transporter permease subunit [Thermoanaerobaculia bacterium]